ncbi:hypothetical protein PV328_010333 [Microctonus aethiopoides]|uniref:Uncharacterized protein n=1 Tax=Microctonus aethiopoides TaxID=144406 RepID=A0AA39C7P5_9HYME|nr:hypothetical protein PV328_010333 [Microctonus aethiopoides]
MPIKQGVASVGAQGRGGKTCQSGQIALRLFRGCGEDSEDVSIRADCAPSTPGCTGRQVVLFAVSCTGIADLENLKDKCGAAELASMDDDAKIPDRIGDLFINQNIGKTQLLIIFRFPSTTFFIIPANLLILIFLLHIY